MSWKNTPRIGLRSEIAHRKVAGTQWSVGSDWRFFKGGVEFNFPPRMADWYPCWSFVQNSGTPDCVFGPKIDCADDDILPNRNPAKWGGRLDPYFWDRAA